MKKTRFAGAALALALLAGACGSSAPTLAPASISPTGSGSTSAGPTPAPVSTLAPSGTEVPSGASGAPSPGSSSGMNTYVGTPPPTPHADPALEAKLPDSIRAVTLTKSSFSGSSMPTTQTDQTKPTFDLLARLGKQPADLTFAVASDPRLNVSTQAASALPLFLVAYQVKGTTAEDLMAALLAVAEKYATSGVEKGTASVGGQTLTTYVDNSVPQAGTNYLVPRGDILYVIQTPDSTLAAEALGSLP